MQSLGFSPNAMTLHNSRKWLSYRTILKVIDVYVAVAVLQNPTYIAGPLNYRAFVPIVTVR